MGQLSVLAMSLKPRWQLGHLVAVAHPHLEHAVAFGRGEVRNAVQQPGVPAGTHLGIAKLALVAALHLAAELLGHGLHAIADAQHRHAEAEHRARRAVGAFFVHAGMAARQHHAPEGAICGEAANEVVGHVAGVHLAVDMCLADAAGYQLGNLGAEVKDEDLVVRHGLGGRSTPSVVGQSAR
jgi:hypothetical protein